MNGVLHDRLEKKAGNQAFQRFRRCVNLDLQTICEAYLLNCEIALHYAQFLDEWYLLWRFALKGAAQDGVQMSERLRSFLVPAKIDKGIQSIQSVEQEMRFELHLQGAELRLREPPLQFQLLNDGSLRLGFRMQKTGNGVDEAINHKTHTEALARLQVPGGDHMTHK